MDEFSIAAFPATVYVNPRAGGGRAGKYLAAIQQVFTESSLTANFVQTESSESLEANARDAMDAGCRLLFAVGGDGTLQALVNAAYGSDVVLGVVPAGGGNDFAAALGLPRDPVLATKELLLGRPRRIDLLRAQTADGKRRIYLGGGGLGLDADSANYTAAYTRLPGRLRYVAAALRALRGFKPLRVRAEFPGSNKPAIEGPVLIAAALNTPSYGAGLRLAPNARIDDGLLDTFLVRDLNAARILNVLPGLLASGTLPEKYVTRASAQRVCLSANRECLFHGDGEIFGPAPVEIEVLPKAVRVLAPLAP